MEESLSTEQKILEAAEAEFLEEGFAGARMQQIADRAGINKAMLHYYFRSKDKLFALVFQHKVKEFLPKVFSGLRAEDVPFVEKLDQFVLGYLQLLRKKPGLPLFIVTTMNRNPDFAQLINTTIGPEIIEVLRQEIRQGRIRSVDPHQFLMTVIGMCIFPFLARPMFSSIFKLTPEAYDKIIAERHVHVMQYVRSILTV